MFNSSNKYVLQHFMTKKMKFIDNILILSKHLKIHLSINYKIQNNNNNSIKIATGISKISFEKVTAEKTLQQKKLRMINLILQF